MRAGGRSSSGGIKEVGARKEGGSIMKAVAGAIAASMEFSEAIPEAQLWPMFAQAVCWSIPQGVGLVVSLPMMVDRSVWLASSTVPCPSIVHGGTNDAEMADKGSAIASSTITTRRQNQVFIVVGGSTY